MFELHPRLAADCVVATDWPLCRILLMNDASWPWLILVPQRNSVAEIHELDAGDRDVLIQEIAKASHCLQILTNADKMNVAALGNVVAQLHIHVIARFIDDPAWPKPIFGHQPAVPYAPRQLEERLTQLREVLAS